MKIFKPLFKKFTDDLAPGIQDISKVVKERILYSSASNKAVPDTFKEDSMDVDLGKFSLPIEELKEKVPEKFNVDELRKSKGLLD